jgi:hypothetical protein
MLLVAQRLCDQRRGRCVDESREVSVTAGSQEKKEKETGGGQRIPSANTEIR